MAARRTHVSKMTANKAASEVGMLLGTLTRWQRQHPDVADYRVTESLQLLQRVKVLVGYLVEDVDPEGDDARAKLRESGFFDNNPTPRRVESSSQTPDDATGYNGTNWPTHTIDVWLTNDSQFLGLATEYATWEDDGTRLAEFVRALLFDRSNGLTPPERALLTRDSDHNLDQVVDSLSYNGEPTPRLAFERVDWTYLRSSLLDLS